jgi:hypothetical protein
MVLRLLLGPSAGAYILPYPAIVSYILTFLLIICQDNVLSFVFGWSVLWHFKINLSQTYRYHDKPSFPFRFPISYFTSTPYILVTGVVKADTKSVSPLPDEVDYNKGIRIVRFLYNIINIIL